MKTIVILSCCFLLAFKTMALPDTAHTSGTKAIDVNLIVNVKDSTAKPIAKPNDSAAGNEKTIGGWEWILIFSPAIVFLVVAIILGLKLKGYLLRDALQDDEQPKMTIPNPLYTQENLLLAKDNPALMSMLPATVEISDGHYPKSSSRYIALITSALTWTIALCLSCFYIYEYIATGKAPELNKLTDVVLTLGIGVVPYAFNKLSEAAKG